MPSKQGNACTPDATAIERTWNPFHADAQADAALPAQCPITFKKKGKKKKWKGYTNPKLTERSPPRFQDKEVPPEVPNFYNHQPEQSTKKVARLKKARKPQPQPPTLTAQEKNLWMESQDRIVETAQQQQHRNMMKMCNGALQEANRCMLGWYDTTENNNDDTLKASMPIHGVGGLGEFDDDAVPIGLSTKTADQHQSNADHTNHITHLIPPTIVPEKATTTTTPSPTLHSTRSPKHTRTVSEMLAHLSQFEFRLREMERSCFEVYEMAESRIEERCACCSVPPSTTSYHIRAACDLIRGRTTGKEGTRAKADKDVKMVRAKSKMKQIASMEILKRTEDAVQRVDSKTVPNCVGKQMVRRPGEDLGLAVQAVKGEVGVRVTQVWPNTVAEGAGLTAGMVLVHVDGNDVLNSSYERFVGVLTEAASTFDIVVCNPADIAEAIKQREIGKAMKGAPALPQANMISPMVSKLLVGIRDMLETVDSTVHKLDGFMKPSNLCTVESNDCASDYSQRVEPTPEDPRIQKVMKILDVDHEMAAQMLAEEVRAGGIPAEYSSLHPEGVDDDADGDVSVNRKLVFST